MVIDNLKVLSTENLRGCREEAEALLKTVCQKEQEFGQRKLFDQTPRCDTLMWLTDLIKQDAETKDKTSDN